MTEEELLAAGPSIGLMDSATLLGISRNEAYKLAKAGTYPVPTYQVGMRRRVARNDVLTLLAVKRD